MIECQPVEIFPAFEEFLQPARFKIAHGGRGSGKTRTFITLLVDNVLYHGWRVVCFREIQQSIEDSIYQEIIDEIDRRDLLAYFDPQKTSIYCTSSGGVFRFCGLYRNQQKVKGFAGFDCAFIEEAANVTQTSWKMIIPTLRKSNSEIWCCFNPESPLDDTYTRFVSDRVYPDYKNGKRYCIVKKINYTDNPRFPQELQDDMEIMKDDDFELYRHVYLGEPVANSDLAIIPPSWVSAAVDIHKELGIEASGRKLVGFDVADEGPDSNAVVINHGFVVEFIEEWKDTDPNSAAEHAFSRSFALNVDEILFDCIGVGAGAKGEFRKLLEDEEYKAKRVPDVTAWSAADAVVFPDDDYTSNGAKSGKTNKQMFLNAKSQAWWSLRDKFYNAYKARQGKDFDIDNLISFDSDKLDNRTLDRLIAELSQPRREYASGKLRVEPKDKMKKRGVKSPNLADALVMAFAPTNKVEFFFGI